MNYNLKEFLDLNIPDSFQDSLDFYLNKKHIFKCFTPWCIYNGSGDKLVKINSLSSQTHNSLHLCLGCCIKYGVNKESGGWEEYGDLMRLGYQVILPLLNCGIKRFQVSKLTGLSRYKVYKFSSYLARFNLINNEYINNFIPEKKSFVSRESLIKYADKNETTMRYNAQKNLNIRLCDFYYFYYDSTVQEYMFNNAN